MMLFPRDVNGVVCIIYNDDEVEWDSGRKVAALQALV